MNLKRYFIKNVDSFEYLEHLILYVLSLVVVISSILAFELIIFILHSLIYMKIILFYIFVLFILSILTLVALSFFIYVFSNFYEMGDNL